MEVDLLRMKDRIEIALELGESQFREFKSALEGRPGEKIPRDLKEIGYDIGKTLVAFANADGGEVFIGIEDDHTITGLPFPDDKIRTLLDAPRNYTHTDTPLPLKKSVIIDFNGLKVAFFSVEKGARYVHLTAKGECFQRKDRDSVPTASEKIRFAREEEVSREYDRQFLDFAEVRDLDLQLVASIASKLKRAMSPEKFLQYLELAEFDGSRLRLRRAALLLFAKNITKWNPRSQVRLLKINGTEEKTGLDFNVKELGEEQRGNIFTLIESSWDALRPHLAETRLSKDGRFQNQIIYPEQACREALINAVVHRDYSIDGRGIEIRIFDDRLEILSPGKLLSSITIQDLEELKGVHQTRNTYVGRVLNEFGYIRELGEGIRRIYETMQLSDLVPPKIQSPNKSFIVTLFHKQVYTKEEKLWLENFADVPLTPEQKIVVRLGVNGRLVSPNEIFEQTGIVDTEKYRQLVEGMSNMGLLKRVIERDAAKKEAKKKGSNDAKAIPQYQILLPMKPLLRSK
ncbi:MAG: ATP-binding protein [Saprospiraceae bacterium]